MTLLERWDELGAALAAIRPDEIRRAIAIKQAVDEGKVTFQMDEKAKYVLNWIDRLADEMLRGEP